MTTITETALERLLTGDADGLRCILCDRVWPKDVMPLWHHFIWDVLPDSSDCVTEKTARCSCGGTHDEPTWHVFDFTCTGHLVVIVCGKCIPIRGMSGAAVNAAGIKALCAVQNARKLLRQNGNTR